MMECNILGNFWNEMCRSCFPAGEYERKRVMHRIAFVLAKTAAGAHPKSVGKEVSELVD